MSIPAAWHPDPTGRHEYRYWDGGKWTDYVADAGQVATDPLVAATPTASTAAATPVQAQTAATSTSAPASDATSDPTDAPDSAPGGDGGDESHGHASDADDAAREAVEAAPVTDDTATTPIGRDDTDTADAWPSTGDGDNDAPERSADLHRTAPESTTASEHGSADLADDATDEAPRSPVEETTEQTDAIDDSAESNDATSVVDADDTPAAAAADATPRDTPQVGDVAPGASGTSESVSAAEGQPADANGEDSDAAETMFPPPTPQPVTVATAGDVAAQPNGLATAAMVIGIVSLVLAIIPVVGVLGVLGGILALIFGIVARGRATRGASGRGASTAGIVTGVIAMLLGVATTAIVVLVFDGMGAELAVYMECVAETGDEQACAQAFERALLDRFGAP